MPSSSMDSTIPQGGAVDAPCARNAGRRKADGEHVEAVERVETDRDRDHRDLDGAHRIVGDDFARVRAHLSCQALGSADRRSSSASSCLRPSLPICAVTRASCSDCSSAARCSWVAAARRQPERVGAPVGVGLAAPHEAALLQVGDGRDEIRLLDAERGRHARLAGARILIDHQQHRKLAGTQVEFRQGMVEIRKNDALRPSQGIAHVSAEWRQFRPTSGRNVAAPSA